MTFDERAGVAVLFGGRANEDPATGLTYASDETWFWVRKNWVQQFPAHKPPGRSSHAMAYDSRRGRVILFGGRKEATVVRTPFTVFDDTWAWQNGDWTRIETGTAPPGRVLAAMAYDRDRDRMVLFGGYAFDATGRNLTALSDTWEFDGSSWTRVSADAPKLEKPLMAYDAARREMILLGIDTEAKTLMYRWDPAGSTWRAITPQTLPTCVNEANMVYQFHNERLVVAGGVCSAETAFEEETWEWDGSNWTKLTTNLTTRITGGTATYDTTGGQVVRYGGFSSYGSLLESFTSVYRNLVWESPSISGTPEPRSLPVFRRDLITNTIMLLGGLSEFSYGNSISYNSDQWQYLNGVWYRNDHASRPGGCVTPLAAFDTDRKVMVVVCSGNEVSEWDGTTWKNLEGEKPPAGRRFAGLVYDQNIKKVVLFGGYDGLNFREDTWTWDGKTWTEIKAKTKPPHRSQMAMWYDPLAKKTIIYSGVGRRNIDERVTRYSDMWSFDGTTWTQMSVAQTPGIRFGAQYAIDPRDGKVLLFGGLRATIDEKKNVSQFYGNDTWLWDGAANRWTELTPASAPPPRQNGGFEYDAASGKFVLFGGFGGNLYLSDTWVWDGTNWTPVTDEPVVNRRRSTRP